MLLVASQNGGPGMEAGWEILSSGGTALDAVEAATRCVEDDPDEHTVGVGGYPNLLGEVELDASIMDGSTRRSGAVGALRGYRAAITVARQVMERLPHVMLVDRGAARFAAEIGLPTEDILTDAARKAYTAGLDGHLPTDFHDRTDIIQGLIEVGHAHTTLDPEPSPGTVNFLAQDVDGHLASAVSTSGWAFKYPGRVGDSGVIGAGNYADGRYGAVACTGWGELALRAGTARSVVHALGTGLTLAHACRRAFTDLATLDTDLARYPLIVVALDKHGNHIGASIQPGRTYLVQSTGMTTYDTLPCTVAPVD